MNVEHSTPTLHQSKPTKPAKIKPAKPNQDWPMFAHGSGQWAAKIKGKLFYFGAWGNPEGALAKWHHDKRWRERGLEPPKFNPELMTVLDLFEDFLQSRERLVATGEMASKTYAGYKWIIKKVMPLLGEATPVEHLRPDDFAQLRAERVQVAVCRNGGSSHIEGRKLADGAADSG